MNELTENDQVFLKNLSILDPSLWRVKVKLIETGINPDILPGIIEAVSYVANTTKWGKVEVDIKNGIVTITSGHIYKRMDIDIGL